MRSNLVAPLVLSWAHNHPSCSLIKQTLLRPYLYPLGVTSCHRWQYTTGVYRRIRSISLIIVFSFTCYYLFLTGHMVYAIISFSVGERIFSWLFQLLLLIFRGQIELFTSSLLLKVIPKIRTGCELKVRQIEYNIIFGWRFVPIIACPPPRGLFSG